MLDPEHEPPAPGASSAAGCPPGEPHSYGSPGTDWVPDSSSDRVASGGGLAAAAEQPSQDSVAAPTATGPHPTTAGPTAAEPAPTADPAAPAPERGKGKRQAAAQPERRSSRLQRVQADAPDGQMQDAA